MESKIQVCKKCGSDNIIQLEWRNPNTGELSCLGPDEKQNRYCEECEEHVDFMTLAEFKNKENEKEN